MELRETKRSVLRAIAKGRLKTIAPLWRSMVLGRKLRTVLVVPWVLQIICAVGLVGYVSTRTGRSVITQLKVDFIEEVESHLVDRISLYLQSPHKLNKLNDGSLNFVGLNQNLSSLEQQFWRQGKIFNELGYIAYTNEKKDFVGLALNEQGPDHFQISNSQGELETFLISNAGERQSRINKSSDFDPTQESWYQKSKNAGRAIWTDIYSRGTPPTLAITLGQPHYNLQGEFEGVLAIDLTLEKISRFLRDLEIGKTGQIFIVERNGLMVATSTQEMPFEVGDMNKPRRLSGLRSENLQTRKTLEFLHEKYGNLNQILEKKQDDFMLNGERHFLYVTPLRDENGLDWLTVIVVPESDFIGRINQNLGNTVLICLIAGCLTYVIGTQTARLILDPISRINQAATAIAGGQFDQQLDSHNIQELDELAHSFNNMASQLQLIFMKMTELNAALVESELDLANINKNLEDQVHLQTQELVQSEKMVALGQLTAGIAHEINTPLGVIQASSENIESAFVAAMAKLPHLLQSLPPDELTAFFVLLNQSRQAKMLLSSREERKLKRDFKKCLQDLEISPVAPIASTLSRMGLSTDVEAYLPILKSPHNTEILETVYQFSIVQNNSGNILQAIQRVSKIVFALKSYARHDLSSQQSQGSIPASIETVLTLYHHQLKQGIEVITEFEKLPDVWCYPEELAQVWTNLIHNAIQAMDHKGCLTLKAYQKEDSIWVEVNDTGTGIPPDVIDHIFTPFFTTKPAGVGNGLGLDIVSKIIQKHEGQITVESQPGNTTFYVQIPMRLEKLSQASSLPEDLGDADTPLMA